MINSREQNKEKQIAWFSEIGKENIGLVGGKGANLGEITEAGFPIPPGFIITAAAYWQFIEENNLKGKIQTILKGADVNDPAQLNDASQKIKKLINFGKVPLTLAKKIISGYEKLGGIFGQQPLVAIRSSATAEDLPDASFAGQQETFLNIKGEANLINNVRSCWASLFTPRGIFYREQKKFDLFKIGIAVIVQKMIQAKTSGVIFTIDPVTEDKSKIIIEAVWGLGELIVQGTVTPDHFEIDKNTFKITKKQVNEQKVQLIKSGTLNKQTIVKLSLRKRQKISDELIIQLAKIAKKIHDHYYYPQDIEWAIERNKIYILQTRPVTTLNQKSKIKNQNKEEKITLPLIIKGDPASPGIASGQARLIISAKDINKLQPGEILVTKMTSPDFVPAMKKSAGIITDEGGQTSHAAIVSRELGIPCVVGTGEASKVIKDGSNVTLNGKTGEIFKGSPEVSRDYHLRGDVALTPVSSVYKIRTATKLYVNLGEPELAEEIAKKNVDGVGLLRAEFMISEYIKYHPKKLMADKKQSFFIEKLAEGIAKICQAFNPRPVVYRATDFKTNEYANLIGGKAYEPKEPNPLLGYRGALRYIKDKSEFLLELAAIKKVRNEFGFKNLMLMIPFARTVEEYKKVKLMVNEAGLSRVGSFDIWMMVETPGNVILLEDFIKQGLDGISIGSNDLTMLVLGADRDNETLAYTFDERDPAVLWFLEKTIKTCLKHNIPSSICGQAPSTYPDFTQKLVEWGITSVSVSPDMIEQTRQIIYQAELKRVEK